MTKTIVKAPFKADHVGSFLRTEPIKKTREAYLNGELDKDALKEIEDQEIEKLVQKQMEVGLQSITDGEFRRSWWHIDFLAGLDGIELFETEHEHTFLSAKPTRTAMKVAGKVDFHHHEM